MGKFRRRSEVMDGIRFDGTNWKEVQKFVGVHYADPAKQYEIPNFDSAETWWPARTDKSIVAVLYTAGDTWTEVREGDFISKSSGRGNNFIIQKDSFERDYEEVAE